MNFIFLLQQLVPILLVANLTSLTWSERSSLVQRKHYEMQRQCNGGDQRHQAQGTEARIHSKAERSGVFCLIFFPMPVRIKVGQILQVLH